MAATTTQRTTTFPVDAEPCEDCTGNGEPCDTCYGWGHITDDLRPLVFSIDEMHDTREELEGDR